MSFEPDPRASPFPAVNPVPAGAAFGWLAAGWADFRAHPGPSLFYGLCFAAMGWAIALTFRHAYAYASALITGFFLVGPFFAIGLYALSRRRQPERPGLASAGHSRSRRRSRR